jgi:hypothetical protein
MTDPIDDALTAGNTPPCQHLHAIAMPALPVWTLWCPTCKEYLTKSEAINVILALLRKAANL